MHVDGPWLVLERPHCTIRLLLGDPAAAAVAESGGPATANLDVVVLVAADGSAWTGTVFTLDDIAMLMDSWEATGECAGGRYFFSSSAVIVRSVAPEQVADVLDHLVASGEYVHALEPSSS